MRTRIILDPVPGRRAFGRDDEGALLSQAAFLLLLRAQLRGDPPALRARATAAKRGRHVDAMPARDAAAFPVPRVTFTGRRISMASVKARVGKRYGRRVLRVLDVEAGPAMPLEVLADLTARLHRTPTPERASELMEACLRHPYELPRIAAAAAYFPLSAEPQRLVPVLAHGTESRDVLVRDVAATALARVAPEHSRLKALLRRRARPRRGTPSRTSLIVHGTWGRGSAWWQPGGDFHTYLRTQVRQDLYSADDRFEWSGGYSDEARALGARDLLAWVDAKGHQGLDLFTHSHGGSVAMLASQAGLSIGTLVLLSCPVHIPKYAPDLTRVGKIVSVRVHLDLVILVDGGGQRFRDPNIHENVLPIWFDHFATHDPAVWQQFGVPAML